jgi:hypothetical protein
MGRYTGVKEMIEISKMPREYKYPLTPLGSLVTKLALTGVSPNRIGMDNMSSGRLYILRWPRKKAPIGDGYLDGCR